MCSGVDMYTDGYTDAWVICVLVGRYMRTQKYVCINGDM